MSAGRAARAILVLLHIEAVTRALPEPFSASFSERESEAGCIFQCASKHPCILIVSAVSSYSAFFLSSFPASFSSSSLRTGSSFNYRGNAPRCQSLYYPTVSSRRVDYYSLDSPRPPHAARHYRTAWMERSEISFPREITIS